MTTDAEVLREIDKILYASRGRLAPIRFGDPEFRIYGDVVTPRAALDFLRAEVASLPTVHLAGYVDTEAIGVYHPPG